MTFAYFDRIAENSTSTGTGNISLGGAVSGFRAFSSVYSDGDTMYYCITEAALWEVGSGTYQASGNQLVRSTVIASSNANSLVNFTIGLLFVFTTIPAAQFAGSTGGATGTGPIVFATSPTLTGIVNAGGINVTGIAPPADGIYLSAANIPAISANSNRIVTFQSNGVASHLDFLNTALSGLGTITAPTAPTAALAGGGAGNLSSGNYSYKVTYISPVGETAVGTISNIINVTSPSSNGKMALTAISTSVSGVVTARNIYRTQAGGSTYFFLHQIVDNTTTTYTDNIADTALTYQAASTQAQIPTYYQVSIGINGPDTATGVQYRAFGTTTSGAQFNGNSTQGGILSTGNHQFLCNGRLAMEITDTLWNPNQSYQGAPTAWPVISSGALAGGPDNICMISCNSSIYSAAGGTTANGVTLAVGARGTTGAIHFLNNGLLGHVSISAPGNTLGTDVYATPNILWLSGSQAGSAKDALIYTNYGASDSGIGITFYNQGTGSYTYLSGNTATNAFKVFGNIASAVNAIYVKPAATAGVPMVGAGWAGPVSSPDANCALGLTSSGTGPVNFYSAAGTVAQGAFDGSGHLIVNNLTGIGNVGGDANANCYLQVLGTDANSGAVIGRFSASATQVKLVLLKSRGATVGAHGAVVSGDILSKIYTYGDDGTNYVNAASINVTASGTISAGVVPSVMDIQTANTIGVLTTGISIDNAQNVNIATNNIVMNTAQKGLVLKRGGNGKVGQVTLSGTTTVTVSNTSIATSDLISFSLSVVGGTVGAYPIIKTITAASQFTVAGSVGDVSTYNYAIISNAF